MIKRVFSPKKTERMDVFSINKLYLLRVYKLDMKKFKVALCVSLLILPFITSCSKSSTPKTYDFDGPRASQTCMSPTFQGKWEKHSTEQIDSGMQLAASLAVETLHVGFEWGQVENQSGEFDWHLTDRIIGVGDVRTSVVINMLDARLPSDISMSDFGNDEYTERFVQMLQAFLERYHENITHLWIGNEVNISLEEHGISAAEYGAFYEVAVSDLRNEYPDIKFGVIVTYAYEDEKIISDLIDEVQEDSIIGFTFYPQFLGHEPNEAKKSFDLLDLYASEKDINYAIVETAWSTAGVNGSEDNQVDYIKSYLPLVSDKEYANRDFVCYWSLYDPKIPAWQKLFLGDSVDYLESLGLLENDGTKKPAWEVFNEELSKLIE